MGAMIALSHISFLHQTTTIDMTERVKLILSHISFLHQTTTPAGQSFITGVLSHISFLHQTTTYFADPTSVGTLSHISFLHQTTTVAIVTILTRNCLISLFYIKPQLCMPYCAIAADCLISLFYIKPQLFLTITKILFIVSYLFSTSNHNLYSPILSFSTI